ncbi:hypothetical protein ELI43_36920 [Rhizobium leguminosarum]|uniref:hypothetical protein n=1 Tax=Rhizobium leguminosarum TaxID=384 RepID=UPI001030197B|nr:hypothetical protein [Rhizobium leguminosarum]TAU35314.1 hypothetical protein ELI43_36920 [Rhizobium leguminosarum]
MPIRLPATVLLLEDEAIIAIDAEEMLTASGVSQVFTHDSEKPPSPGFGQTRRIWQLSIPM